MNSSTIYTVIAVVLAIVVVCLFFFFPNYLSGLSMNASDDKNSETSQTTSPTTQTETPTAAPTTLSVQDMKVGTGATAQSGDKVAVEYVGKLADGTIFDQSSAHPGINRGCSKAGQFCFTLGAGEVIAGWDQGVAGMKVGGERTLVIPASLGYGSQQMGPIPANSTLYFDVKLVGVNQPASADANFVPIGPGGN